MTNKHNIVYYDSAVNFVYYSFTLVKSYLFLLLQIYAQKIHALMGTALTKFHLSVYVFLISLDGNVRQELITVLAILVLMDRVLMM